MDSSGEDSAERNGFSCSRPCEPPREIEAIIGLVTDAEALRPNALRSFLRAPILPAVLADGTLTNDRCQSRCAPTMEPSSSRTRRRSTPHSESPNRSGAESSTAEQSASRSPPDLLLLLVIGGVPRSDLLPSVLAIGCSVLLLLVGILQLRREGALVRLRHRFVASVSHELRTPLTQIRMFAETLLLDACSKPGRESPVARGHRTGIETTDASGGKHPQLLPRRGGALSGSNRRRSTFAWWPLRRSRHFVPSHVGGA